MTKKPTYEELEQRVKELTKEAVERKWAEEALKQSEEMYRTVVESTSDAVLLMDIERKIVSCNQAFLDLFGYDKNEIEGRSTRIIHQSDDSFRSFGKKAYPIIERVGTYRTEWEFIRKDSAIVPVETVTSAIKSPDGSIRGYVAIIRDITERKRAEEALKESQRYTRGLIEASLDTLVTISAEGKITDLNHATELITGLSRNEIIGTEFSDYFTDPDSASKGYQQVFKDGYVRDYPLDIIHRDGKVIPVLYNASVYKDAQGCVTGVFAAARDMTEHKQAEVALRESEERYRSLFEDSGDTVYITTWEGKIVDINEAGLDLFGYSRKEIMDLNILQIYANPDDRPRFQKEIEKKGSVKDFALKLCRKDGTQMDCLLTSSVWLAYDGSTLGYQGIIRDITERKRVEEELREREAELKIKATSLEEVNTALRVLLKRREEDKTELEERLLSNVKELVVPFLGKVKKTQLDPKQVAYIAILESNLNDIISPFLRNLSSKYVNLTPKEIQVAHLIKEGRTNKEIGEVMSLSPRTIETHRKNMRKKLGIEKGKGNLRSHLLHFQ